MTGPGCGGGDGCDHRAQSFSTAPCLGVIAPELTRDLGLTPEDLGNANGAFFLAIAFMQVPVGLLFDRYGPRRVVSWLTVLAVLAAAMHGMVRTPGELSRSGCCWASAAREASWAP